MKKAKTESGQETLASVKKEMAEPRMATSVRKKEAVKQKLHSLKGNDRRRMDERLKATEE